MGLWMVFSYTKIKKEEVLYSLPATGLAFLISQRRRFLGG